MPTFNLQGELHKHWRAHFPARHVSTTQPTTNLNGSKLFDAAVAKLEQRTSISPKYALLFPYKPCRTYTSPFDQR